MRFKIIIYLFIIISFLMGCNKQYKWRIQSQAPKTNPDFVALQKFCENVKNMSNGQLVITAHAAGEITKGPGIFDGVKDGKTEMGLGWPNWWLGKDPGWSVLQSGPYGFMNIDASLMYFYEDDGIKLGNEMSKPHGIIWRPAWWAGMEFGILTNFPVRTLADLKGKKIRIGPGIPAETLLDASGAFATPTVPQEINKALENKQLDGVEWTVPSATWNMNFHKVCSHVIVPAVWQPSVLGDFLINEKAYNSLPAHLQAILEIAMKEYALYATFHGKTLDMEALENYKKKGIKIVKWSAVDLKKWKTSAAKIYAKHAKKSKMVKRILDSKKKFKEKYNKYYSTHGAYE